VVLSLLQLLPDYILHFLPDIFNQASIFPDYDLINLSHIYLGCYVLTPKYFDRC